MPPRPPTEPLPHRPYPIHVVLAGRKVLVVGAGGVAARRIERLLDAGARVVVVAPEAGAAVRRLADEKRVELHRREWGPDDLDGAFLVHTAANDPAVNEAVVAAVRARAATGAPAPLVCAADRSWRTGDFIVPASFDHGVMTVSVGTGGHDCRMSRDVKTALRMQVDALQGAELLVLGADQRTVDLERREALARTLGDGARVARSLLALRAVGECFVLSTCNRIEVYAIAGPDPVLEDVASRILGFDSLDPGHRYLRRGRDAFVHLSLVMSGAHAELFGETAIVAQVRAALDAARAAGTAGPGLGRLVDEALCVSRRVRSAVMDGLGTREVEDLCVARVQASRPGCRDGTVLVIGTGAVGRAIVTRLDGGRGTILWAHFRHAPDLAGLPNAGRIRVIHADDVGEHLAACDVVIVASGAKEPLIRAADAPRLAVRRPLVMDLSVPRGVDPALAGSHDIDIVDLQALVGAARPSDVQALVQLAEEAARLESFRHMRDDEA